MLVTLRHSIRAKLHSEFYVLESSKNRHVVEYSARGYRGGITDYTGGMTMTNQRMNSCEASQEPCAQDCEELQTVITHY